MCTTVHKINFDKYFFQNLKIYSIEVVCANFEGSTTIFIFYPKFAYDLVRTTVHGFIYLDKISFSLIQYSRQLKVLA